VDGKAEFFYSVCLGVPHGEGLHVVGHPQVLGDLACGVVVARDDKDPDAFLAKPGHLVREEEPRVVVLPVAVVEVPRKQDEVDLLRSGQLDEILEGPAGSPADLLHGRTFVDLEPDERTVEMDVGGVDEFHNALSIRAINAVLLQNGMCNRSLALVTAT